MDTNKVWFITGASKGLGLSLVKQLLTKGYKVAATTRTRDAYAAIAGYEDNFLPLVTDLKSEESVASAFEQTINKFGKLDVVVNNAGYGLGGALEELTTAEITENFEVNFFAVVRVIRQALPYLRKQGSGFIINISSIAGFAPGTGWSMYSAAKFAVSGLSDALSNDLKPLGIHVTNVMPGWFRTNFAKSDSIVYNEKQIADYDYLREFHKKMSSMDGLQQGDPDKVADVFIQLVNNENPPVDLFLGSDAFVRAKARLDQLSDQMNNWKTLSYATDFD